jgi:hypothetical protein
VWKSSKVLSTFQALGRVGVVHRKPYLDP